MRHEPSVPRGRRGDRPGDGGARGPAGAVIGGVARHRLALVALCCSLLGLALHAGGDAAPGSAVGTGPPATGISPSYVPGSTRFLCWLTGDRQESATDVDAGLIAADLGYSFDYGGRLWWFFGDSHATKSFDGVPNASTRWPNDLSANANDSVATSPEGPPGRCPVLDFVTEHQPVPGAYASPSVSDPDASGASPQQISLRTNETPVAGLEVDSRLYATFSTDNPIDACRVDGKCPSPASLGRSTRSVLAVLDNKSLLQFDGRYDLSKPATRYGNGAKFVSNAMQEGRDGYVYIWGVEAGSDFGRSAPYLARISAAEMDTGAGLEYFAGVAGNEPTFTTMEPDAAALFHDDPDCMSFVSAQYNVFFGRWLMLYNCGGNGIYLRSAPDPWGPWSAPQVVFDPAPDMQARTGYCYFMYSPDKSGCPSGAPNPRGRHDVTTGRDYAPYFVAGWTRGTTATATTPTESTFYYTISTLNPYGEVLVQSSIEGRPPVIHKPPPCKGTSCA